MRNPEIWIILIIVGFLLFGAKKMPDAARGLGRSLRIFKAETKGLGSDDEHPPYQQQPAQQQQIPPAQPYQQQPYQQQPYQQQPYQQPASAVGQTAPTDASADRPQAQ
jgi:sec-independent protein translocase protein TatA